MLFKNDDDEAPEVIWVSQLELTRSSKRLHVLQIETSIGLQSKISNVTEQ